MTKIGELYKQADWKTEKHVPVIDCPASVQKDQVFEVKVSVGKEVSHPNTAAHHIRWLKLYFLPEGAKAVCHVASLEFTAHGESTEGADQGPAHTHHQGSAFLKLQKGGTILATSYCNIHGLWENSRAVAVG
ncbi:MAG: class II SORL domain-containing protein [Proteobacteria bacterium]|nr:class II SORL domain-containing protein [Pseudomonadota bacterium]